MTRRTEALKLALEAFKQIDEAMPFPVAKLAQKVICEALAEQPAQPQEPVAWIYEFYADRGNLGLAFEPQRSADNTPLYGTPQPLREWVGLTRKQVDDLADDGVFLGNIYEITDAIEAKLKEKNSD